MYNEIDPSELFAFCMNNEKLKDFKVVNAEESEHYYYEDVLVGGWAGDKQDYFIKGSEQLDFLNSALELYKKQLKQDKQVESSQNNTIIKLKVRTENVIFGDENLIKIKSVRSNKSLGYIDGPEDPIYDLDPINSKEMLEHLQELQDNGFDFPRKPIVYVNDVLFAKPSITNGDLLMDTEFMNNEAHKYDGYKFVNITVKQTEDQKYIATHEIYGSEAGYIKDDEKPLEPKKFDSIDDLNKALNERLGHDTKAFVNGEPFIQKMQIVLKPDALQAHSKSTPAHAGYTKETMSWRDSIRKIIEHNGNTPIDVETKYLHDNSFMVKAPEGYSVSIPDYMVSEVINDKRKQKEKLSTKRKI
jgi:hypothetical protein